MDQGWAVDILPRHSIELLVLTKDGEVRGQVQVNTQDEKRRWLRAMKEINAPLEPESTSERLINR